MEIPIQSFSSMQGMDTSRAAERWERWERVPSQFEILAAILADDLRTFVEKKTLSYLT